MPENATSMMTMIVKSVQKHARDAVQNAVGSQNKRTVILKKFQTNDILKISFLSTCLNGHGFIQVYGKVFWNIGRYSGRICTGRHC